MEGTLLLGGGLGVKSVDHHLGSKRTMIVGSDQSNSSDVCRHFSIRGYVGEIRRLNRKVCWPFAVHDNRDNLDEETERLPPLSVPKFKWWCCQKCSGFADICLDDQRGDILGSTYDYNVKACAMHIELKVEHVPVDSREEHSRASNYERCCKNLLPISITSGIRNEVHEHLFGEKKMESFVSSTTAATTIENVHLSDCIVNAEGQESTETRHEELTSDLGDKASQGKEKTRKKVAKRLVDRKQDELGQCKPVPYSKSENNVLSKLAFQVFSSKGFDENSNFESDIPKSLGHSKHGCDQEKNLELKRKNIPGKGKKNVKIDIDHKKHHDIMSYSGCKDDRDAGSGSVVAEIGYLNLSSNDCDSSGDDYCLDESKFFSLHNVDHQMQGHLSLLNCGSQHSNDQFCLVGTACRKRTQKTRLLSDIINECDMLVATERVSVSKRMAAMGSLKETIIQAKTSSEGSPTKNHVAPHEEFTESNEMNNKVASHTRVSDSTTAGSSQDSLCSSSNKHERNKIQGCLEVHENTNYCATEVPVDEQKDSETTIDEIPMDIVELMAKNQHERRLFHGTEHKSMYQLMDTCSKRTPSIMDITAVLENDVASLLDEEVSVSQNLEYTDASDKMFTDTRDKVFTYASKATEIESDEMGSSPVIHRTDHVSACKRKLPPTIDLSREPCFPVSDHYMKNFIQESGWNKKATGCKWLPASIQSAQEYDVLHMAPMQSSLSMHKSPVGMQSTQTMKLECHCCSRDFDYLESVVIAKGSGKMIDPGILDMKGMNSRAAPCSQNGKEMVVSKSLEKSYPFSWRNNQVDCHPKDMFVSDLYKNEAVSAMNLLRLVNRDTLSGATDKSCDESLARLMNESQFFHNSQSNAPVAPGGYVSNISETSLQPMTPEGRDLNFPLRSIGRLLSPLTDVSGACSLPKDRLLDTENRKIPFCSMGHFSSKVSLMMHRVMSSYPTSPRECDHERFSGSHKPIHCLSQCAPDSISISRRSHKREQLSSFRPTETCDEKDAKPQCAASDAKLEICTLNRNPAEVNMYEEEDDSFIVQPEFHKFGNLSPTSNKYWKRQKTVKLAAIKANI